jgi:hypothetical protein
METLATPLPETDAVKSAHEWDQFFKRAEPTREACAKIKERLSGARLIPVALTV